MIFIWRIWFGLTREWAVSEKCRAQRPELEARCLHQNECDQAGEERENRQGRRGEDSGAGRISFSPSVFRKRRRVHEISDGRGRARSPPAKGGSGWAAVATSYSARLDFAEPDLVTGAQLPFMTGWPFTRVPGWLDLGILEIKAIWRLPRSRRCRPRDRTCSPEPGSNSPANGRSGASSSPLIRSRLDSAGPQNEW